MFKYIFNIFCIEDFFSVCVMTPPSHTVISSDNKIKELIKRHVFKYEYSIIAFYVKISRIVQIKTKFFIDILANIVGI